MIAIQIILIAGFCTLLLFFLGNPKNLRIQAWKKIFGLMFIVIAIFFVIFPDISNSIAHSVGVSRGADLMLYILILAFVFVTINMYIRIQQDENKIDTLARKLAITEANHKKSGK